MKTQKGFLSKLNPSNLVGMWGFPARPTTSQVVEEVNSELAKKTETVTTTSVISVSPSSDSHVKVGGLDENIKDPIVTTSCRISSQGDALTIVYDCDEEPEESSKSEKHVKAQEFFSCLNLEKEESESCSLKSSSEEVCGSLDSLENSEINLNENLDDETPEVVKRGTTPRALSCVELNQVERVSVGKSASEENMRQKVTSSGHSSCLDEDGEPDIGQNIISDETEQKKPSLQDVTPTSNGGQDKAEKRKLSAKKSCEEPTKKLSKNLHRLSRNSSVQTGRKLDREWKGEHGDTTTCSILPSLADLTSGKTQTEFSPFTTTELMENDEHSETVESNKLEMSDSATPFPNRMTMRSYQNVAGRSVWELSFRFK